MRTQPEENDFAGCSNASPRVCSSEMLTEENLRKLLRLKRYERPADPEYFQKFLAEFQRRQRAELLRTPYRTLLAERLVNIVREFEMPRLAYAGALGVFALLVALLFMQPEVPSQPGANAQIAYNEPSQTPLVAGKADAAGSVGRHGGMLLDGITLPQAQAVPVSRQNFTVSEPPRYVLDARPVSYEATFSF